MLPAVRKFELSAWKITEMRIRPSDHRQHAGLPLAQA